MLLLEALQLESFSPLQSHVYTKTPGWNLKQRKGPRVTLFEKVHLGPHSVPASINHLLALSTRCLKGESRLTGCAHVPTSFMDLPLTCPNFFLPPFSS